MPLIIEKTYSGSEKRELLPVKREFIGIKGDAFSATLKFKLPQKYDTGWTKYIEFDAVLTDPTSGTQYTPTYVLPSNNQFALPGDLLRAVAHNELSYNLKFVNTATPSVIEKSKIATLTVEDSNEGTVITPSTQEDAIARLERVKVNKPTQTGTTGQILAKGEGETTYWKDDAVREIVTSWGNPTSNEKVPSEKLVKDSLDGKVNTEANKRLMTDTEGTKLAGIASGAEVNVQSDWSVTDTGSDAYILNKPAVPDDIYLQPYDMGDCIRSSLSLRSGGQHIGNTRYTDRLYKGTGRNTNGGMTQKAITDALGNKQDARTVLNNINGVMENDDGNNPLASKSFVNSSIATETAHYISNNGEPFTSVAQLEAYTGTVTNNDYAFVTGIDEYGNSYYDRYKATVSGSTVTWAKEYRLNNSSFTAEQWSAISSGITSTKVSAYDGYASAISNKQDQLVSGTNIKTVNNTSLLGFGNIDASDIFWATYNETSMDDIYSAFSNNKLVMCRYSTSVYILQVATNTIARFYHMNPIWNWDNAQITIGFFQVQKQGDVTSYSTMNQVYFEHTGNMTNALSSSSTDTQYPSAKCVYDNLATKQKTITYGTSDPSGGSDGDIYIKYEE